MYTHNNYPFRVYDSPRFGYQTHTPLLILIGRETLVQALQPCLFILNLPTGGQKKPPPSLQPSTRRITSVTLLLFYSSIAAYLTSPQNINLPILCSTSLHVLFTWFKCTHKICTQSYGDLGHGQISELHKKMLSKTKLCLLK